MADMPKLRIKYSIKAYEHVKSRLIREGQHYKLPYVGPYILVEVGNESKIHCFCTGRKQAVMALAMYNERRNG